MFSGRIEGNAAYAIRVIVEFANEGTIEGRSMPERQSQRLRHELLRDLGLIADGRRLPPEDIRMLLERARHLGISPQGYDAEAGALVYSFTFWSWAAFASYHLLVLDAARRDGRGFPADLRRCRLDSCGRFFFVSDRGGGTRGRPRTAYCCAEHMLAQHLTTSADRVARHRERRRVSNSSQTALDGAVLPVTRLVEHAPRSPSDE